MNSNKLIEKLNSNDISMNEKIEYIDDYFLLGIDIYPDFLDKIISQEIREYLLKGHVENNGQINKEYLEKIKSQEVRKHVISKYIENKKEIDSQILKTIESQKAKEELLYKYIENDGKLKYKFIEQINSQDVRINLIDKYIEKNGEISSDFLITVNSQDARKELIYKYIENGGRLEFTFLETIDSQEIRGELAKAYTSNNGKINYWILRTIDSQKVKEELVRAHIENGGRINNYFLEEIESEGVRTELIKAYIKNKGEIHGNILITIKTVKKRDEIIKEYALYNNDIELNLFYSIRTEKIKAEVLVELCKEDESIKDLIEVQKELLLKRNKKIELIQDDKRRKKEERKFDSRLSVINDILKMKKFFKDEYYGVNLEIDLMSINKWIEKGYVPEKYIFDRVKDDEIEKFDIKMHNNVLKKVNGVEREEEKIAILNLEYIFGLHDKDMLVARGVEKTEGQLTDEEKGQKGAWENAETRKEVMIKFVNKIIEKGGISKLHEIADYNGFIDKFKPGFYDFLIKNVKLIEKNVNLKKKELSEKEYNEDGEEIEGNIGKLQQELGIIYRNIEAMQKHYQTGTPTLEQCRNYIIMIRSREYENIEEGNKELAKLCKLAGVNEEVFQEYQKIFNESKVRETSSIPRIRSKGKREVISEEEKEKVVVERGEKGNDVLKVGRENKTVQFEVLRMDNPRATVIGEKIFSRCCQSVGGAGEECMRHSAESKNGGIVEITSEDGTFLGQSWCWVNGNVLCFDSAELKALSENENITSSQRQEYLTMIAKGYKELAKKMMEESEKKVEEYKKEQIERLKKELGEESSKYKEKEQIIEEKCEQIKIKQVTLGRGYWPISLELAKIFEEQGLKKIEESRAKPIERVDYLNDSDTQYVLAQKEGEKIKVVSDSKEQESIYVDSRRIIIEEGEKVSLDTISKVKKIEKNAHKESMCLMQDIDTVTDNMTAIEELAYKYEVDAGSIKIMHGEDWYYVYSEYEAEIIVHDAARSPKARIEGEEKKSQAEMVEGFYRIMEEANKGEKEIVAQLREDTSYALYLKMLEKGHLEQQGKEKVYDYTTEEEIEYDEEEKEITSKKLKDANERKKMEKEEQTRMHEIRCKVTPKGAQMIERMRQREER